MRVLFIAREGIDLYETLENSDTSRIIFRFYDPERYPWGVRISASSLGIALSLVSELRWYVRRYMNDVLFELKDGIYGTYALAREVYERDIHLDGKNVRRFHYGIKDSGVHVTPIDTNGSQVSSTENATIDEVLEVWAPEQTKFSLSEEDDSSNGQDENHLSKGL